MQYLEFQFEAGWPTTAAAEMDQQKIFIPDRKQEGSAGLDSIGVDGDGPGSGEKLFAFPLSFYLAHLIFNIAEGN